MTRAPVVFVVDDDDAVLRALTRLLAARGLEARAFASPTEFLEAHDPTLPGCAVVDLAMPGLDGLELQRALTGQEPARPIVFLTGRGDIPASVRAMKAGAVDFLTKPVDEELLLSAIAAAIERDAAGRMLQAEHEALRRCFSTLTPRECQVFALVVTGRLNKQIAGDLGVAEKTVKVHRAQVMRKMEVRSLADLVRIAARLDGEDGRIAADR